MTKLNLGIFLFVGIAIALLFSIAQSTRIRFLTCLFIVAALLLPIFLTRGHLVVNGGYVLPVVLTLSAVSVFLVAVRERKSPTVRYLEVLIYLGSFALSLVLFGAVALLHGTSMAGLAHGLVLQHLKTTRLFYAAAPISPLAVPWALLLLLAAVTSYEKGEIVHRYLRLVLVVFLTIVCIRHLIETSAPLEHGLTNRGGAGLLVGFVTPLVWLLLVPNRSESQSIYNRTYFARMCLCCIAVLQPMGAFPIAGTQMAIGSFTLLLACSIATADLLRVAVHGGVSETVRRRVIGTLVALSIVTLTFRDLYTWQRYRELTPVNLPGTRLLRLNGPEVARLKWITGQLMSNGDTFVCLYSAWNSLYFWTQIDSPTTMNANYWPYMLSDQQQQTIIAELDKHADACAVWDRIDALRPGGNEPLAKYIVDNFERIHVRGTIEIWKRRS